MEKRSNPTYEQQEQLESIDEGSDRRTTKQKRAKRHAVVCDLVRRYNNHARVYQMSNERRCDDYSSRRQSQASMSYIDHAARFRRTTREDEARLFTAVDEGYEAYQQLNHPSPDDILSPKEEAPLIELAGARQAIYLSNLRLVHAIATQYRHQEHPSFAFEDYIQQGQRGLAYAVSNFDHTLGNRFSTYATPHIQGDITTGIHEAPLIPIRKHMRSAYNALRTRVHELEAKEGTSLSSNEICQKLNIPPDRYAEIMRRGTLRVYSLDTLSSEGDVTLSDTVPDLRSSELFMDIEHKAEVADLFARISATEREKCIVGLCHDISPDVMGDISMKVQGEEIMYDSLYNAKHDDMTATDLADLLNIVPSTAWRINRKLLIKMRKTKEQGRT